MAFQNTNLSARGEVFAEPKSKIPLLEVVCDLMHPDTNPGGYVSLGVAENVSNFFSREFKPLQLLILCRP